MAKNHDWELILSDVEEEFVRIAAADQAVAWDRERKFALQAIQGSEYLQKCSTESIRNAIINVAAVGITLNPAMKLAYLVPRDGKACLDISYMGLQKLATDTGSVLAVKAELVYHRDEFEYMGPFTPPHHKFNPFDRDNRGDIVGVYIHAKLANKIDQIDTLDMVEIKKIRDRSKAKSGPWKDWFEEMVKKTGIKRAYKSWPRTERLSLAESILNEHEGMEEQYLRPPSGTAAADEARERDRDGVTEIDVIREALEIAAGFGTDSYKKNWEMLTKEQRKALAADHERLKKVAAEATENDNRGDYAPDSIDR